MKTTLFQVHDVIETPGHLHPRLYSVIGIYLGATSQEDCLDLVCVDRSAPTEGDGAAKSMHVPVEMIQAGIEANIFTVTKAE